MAKIERLFERAKEENKIEDIAKQAVLLKRYGKQWRGQCPLCLGKGSKSDSPHFVVRTDHQTFKCFGCGEGGDVIALVAQLKRVTPYEAALELVNEAPKVDKVAEREEPVFDEAADRAKKLAWAAQLWRETRPLIGSLGERYLLARGIDPETVSLAARRVRFHGLAKHHYDDKAGQWVRAPAIIVQVASPGGLTGAIHMTPLLRDGSGRDKSLGKRMIGPQSDAAGRKGGAWLIGPDGSGDLVTGEGLETVLSVVSLMRRTGRSLRAVAGLELERVQGGVIRDEDGCIDFANPVSDPDRPAFTWPWPSPGAWPAQWSAEHVLGGEDLARWPPRDPWQEVIIAVDRDMNPVPAKMKTGGHQPRVVRVMLDGEARARLCGRLAVQAWRRTGVPRARAIVPPPGMDFNDELRRVLEGAA